MRISFILSSIGLSGGVRVVVEFANRLAARGHECFLIAPKGQVEPEMLEEVLPEVGTRLSRIEPGDRPSALRNFLLSWSLAIRVPPSEVIVSTHTPTTIATLVASRLLRRGKPVWLYQDYLEMFLDRPVENWLLRHALAWHDRALTVSEYSKQELGSFAQGDIMVVGEGLSHPELFQPLPEAERRRDNNHRTLLYVGDLRPRKGIYDFLKATEILAEEMPDLVLWIVTKDEDEIQSAVPFQLFHRPPRKKLARLYASCDVFVSASWWESFGLPPIEAMACGAPVVTTDSRGVQEYARPEWNCLVTPPRDPAKLAAAIRRILSDPELEGRLRQNGPPTAGQYTWEGAVNRFEQAIADSFQDA
ncbi:MAG: glycosyltransferase family 4 protein [Anaerolineales bacterium]